MLKGNRKYYLVFAIIFLALVSYQYLSPKPVNWNRTYISSHKIPFGTNAIYQLLESGFISTEIKTEEQSIYSLLNLTQKTRTKATYVFIDSKIGFDKLDTRELMKFVKEGNTAFICTANLSGLLADTFSIESDITFNNYFVFNKDSIADKKPETFVNFTNP